MTRGAVQEEAVRRGFKQHGILFVAPRVGKCRIGIMMMMKLPYPKTLIVYPDKKIKQSWLDEMGIMEYYNPNITYTSTKSLWKYKNEKYDLVFLDEVHLLSEKQIDDCETLRLSGNALLGLTGTLSESTKNNLFFRLRMDILYTYTQAEAIRDGIVSDYRITVIRVHLDNKRYVKYKKKYRTEKQQFDAYTYIINSLIDQGKGYKFLALARMRLIMHSVAKMEMTRKLIAKFKGERILVFCGLKDIADQLGIPVEYTGKEGELERFAKGEGDNLAVVKMGNTGVTFKPLDKVIINYCDSNEENLQQKVSRATNLEYNGKVADIYIVCSTEPVERGWLSKALTPFDKEKIKYETV